MSERRLLLASGVYIDLSEYLLKSEAETLYAPLDAIINKQDRLISGTNIKTINNQNILGSGNITIDVGSSLTESDIAAMGFTKNTGTYSKPSSGIPKSDLASAVQTSLDKADTALQSYTEQYKGTITGVSANGTSVATSGVANIPAASTSAYGVTKLSSATNSTSTTLAATASAVKAAYDLANNYKGTVTGVKINGTTKNPASGVVDLGTVITAHQTLKTINGESIIGSGNIEISGGGGSSDANVAAVDTGDVIDDVTVDYATKTYVDGLVGDINSVLESIISVLESIISGGQQSLFPIILSSTNENGNETYAKVYAELDKISNKNMSSVPIDAGLIYVDLTTFEIGINENSYEVTHIIFEGDNTYSLGTIENGPESHTIMLNISGKVWMFMQ